MEKNSFDMHFSALFVDHSQIKLYKTRLVISRISISIINRFSDIDNKVIYLIIDLDIKYREKF